MKTLVVSFSLLTVAALAGCAAPYYAPAQNERAAAIVPQAVNYRPGFGWVQSVVTSPSPIGSATGGTATDRPYPPVGSQSSVAGRLNRLAIKMDAGGDIQYVDTDSNEFQHGTRVELTPDHMIRKVQ
jgi:hypothetical protein